MFSPSLKLLMPGGITKCIYIIQRTPIPKWFNICVGNERTNQGIERVKIVNERDYVCMLVDYLLTRNGQITYIFLTNRFINC